MPRVKRAVGAKKKRRTVLEQAKGYYGDRSAAIRAPRSKCSIRCSISIVTAATRSVRFAVCGLLALMPRLALTAFPIQYSWTVLRKLT